jgi:hypothetical protein
MAKFVPVENFEVCLPTERLADLIRVEAISSRNSLLSSTCIRQISVERTDHRDDQRHYRATRTEADQLSKGR